MALVINGTTVSDANGVRMLTFTTGTRPANPVEGQVIYNTTTKSLELYDGAYWKVAKDANRPYLYRSVITTSYVLGGYKNSSPWLNVNRMVHSTDVCTNLGDQLNYTAAYYSGAVNKVNSFGFGVNGMGATTTIQRYNMASETAGGFVGDMRYSRDCSASVFKEFEFAYICNGGSAAVDVFNLTTEAIYGNAEGQNTDGGENVGGAMSDETAGYVWSTSYSNKILFSTTVSYLVTDTPVRASHGYQQGISSKLGKGWCSDNGTSNAGYTYRRWIFATDQNIGTVNKPVGNSGEENYDMGQDHNYMFGMHDGAQNNRGQRFSYITETGYELGAGSVRTGVPGGSSGICAWKG
jgi:hypothetical protein